MIAFLARRDAVVGAILLAIGIVYGFLTVSLPNRSLPNTPGPAFFPWLITGVLIVLSAVLLIRAFLDADHAPRQLAVDSDSRLRAFRLGWIVVYLAALPYVGFLGSSVPFFAGMMLFYGERNRTVILFASAVIPGGLFYVFRYGFQILLPSGVW